jgi:hypothetical protein
MKTNNNKCRGCGYPLTWARQKQQFARAVHRYGLTPEQAQQVMPRCGKCLTIRLKDSFEAWLRKTRITKDAVGDLIADLKADHERPKFPSQRDIRYYLYDRNANERAIDLIPRVWQRYHLSKDVA